MNKMMGWLAMAVLCLAGLSCGPAVVDVLDPGSEPLDEKPIAIITASKTYPINAQLLIRSDSFDPKKLALTTHAWSLNQKPEGSSAKLSNTDQKVTTICIDEPGFYTVSLRVTNSESVESDIATHSFRGVCVEGEPCFDTGFCDGTGGDDSGGPGSPSVLITSPTNGESYQQGESVSFSGSADDEQDGPITGDSLKWSSSKDGSIGQGNSISHNNLSVGSHTITLKATDSDNKTGTASVNISIVAVAEVQR